MILAAGRSSRMGSNKALAHLAGKPLIRHVIERLSDQVSGLAINAAPDPANPDWASVFGYPVIHDAIEGYQGPLAGVLAGLLHTHRHDPATSHLLSVPADSPFFPRDLAARFVSAQPSDRDIVVATSCGSVHPVFALWPLAIAGDLATWLSGGDNRRLRDFQSCFTVTEVDFPPLAIADRSFDPFFNINSPDDLAEAHHYAEALSR